MVGPSNSTISSNAWRKKRTSASNRTSRSASGDPVAGDVLVDRRRRAPSSLELIASTSRSSSSVPTDTKRSRRTSADAAPKAESTEAASGASTAGTWTMRAMSADE